MDSTFWGCDPQQVDEHAERLLAGARRMQDLADQLGSSSASARWDGPDGEAHREQTRAATQDVDRLSTDIVGIMRRLRADAEQQEVTSAPEDIGLWQMRAGASGPLLRGGAGPAGLVEDVAEAFRQLAERAEELRPQGAWGGPLQHPRRPGGLLDSPVEGPLPEDSTELNPELVDGVSTIRQEVLPAIPVIGTYLGVAQEALDAHERIGSGLDSLESTLEDTGLGAFTPAVEAARVPWAASGLVLGQEGAVNQSLEGLDRLVANNVQTTVEVGSALTQGDPGEAAAAAEKGVYRVIDAGTDFVVPDSISPWLHSGAGMAEATAGAVEPFSPDGAATVRTAQSALEGWEQDVQQARDEVTGAQSLYDARRRHVPLPYDD